MTLIVVAPGAEIDPVQESAAALQNVFHRRRRGLPAEAVAARQGAGGQVGGMDGIGHQARQCRGERRRVARFDQHAGVAHHLGQAGGGERHGRHAAGDRFGGGQTEPLVERRIDEQAGRLDDAHQVRAFETAEGDQAGGGRRGGAAAGGPRRHGRNAPHQGAAAPTVGAGQDQRRKARVVGRQRFPGVEQGAEVFARFERAGVEQVAIGRSQLGARGGDVCRGRGHELGVDAGVDHLGLFRRGGEVLRQVVGGGARNGDQAARRGQRRAQERQDAHAHLGAMGFGHEQHRQVVDGDHGGDRTGQGHGDQRRPEQVDVAAPQPPRQDQLLPQDAERRRLVFDRDAGGGQLVGAPRRLVGHPQVAKTAAAPRHGQRERAGVDADPGRRRHQRA